jgi:hypothetical protein
LSSGIGSFVGQVQREKKKKPVFTHRVVETKVAYMTRTQRRRGDYGPSASETSKDESHIITSRRKSNCEQFD